MVLETGGATGPWAAGGLTTTRGVANAREPYRDDECTLDGNHRVPGPVSANRVTTAAYLDGSCHTLSEKTDPAIFEAIATIARDKRVAPDF